MCSVTRKADERRRGGSPKGERKKIGFRVVTLQNSFGGRLTSQGPF